MSTKPLVPVKTSGQTLSATELNAIVDHFALKPDPLEVAPINSPTFTGTVGGITKVMVGLTNVDDTTDLNKPVSNPQAAAIALKSTLTTTMGVIVHGAGAATARPTGYTSVTWIGSVQPTNSTENDIWYETAAPVPIIVGSGTFTEDLDPNVYTVNLTTASVGNLMIVALYSTTTLITFTPPAGWDSIHTAQGVFIFARVKQSGDTTFNFTSDSTTTVGVASFYISGATYVNAASVTIGTPTATTSDTGKTISGITLTKAALLIPIITSGSGTPTLVTSGFTLHQAYPDLYSAFRYVSVYKKDQSILTTGDVQYTLPSATNNAGILLGIYS